MQRHFSNLFFYDDIFDVEQQEVLAFPQLLFEEVAREFLLRPIGWQRL